MKYKKNSARLTVQFVDSKTEDILFEIKDKTHMNIGEIFTDKYIDILMQNEFRNKTLPEEITIVVVSEAKLVE